MANGERQDGWTDPPELVAIRQRMRQIWSDIERLLVTRRKLEDDA